ncbi:hypothetical protein PAI11_24850 [Patulibacter medicamentivorans]|uniref:Uncharacterized protein n=1 Tax=Patulibacter medicamentivorans TaxID=1097667 RepID=H0E6N5_9ACTN|nr:hypothetical protein [Patulibacter medicamentivorans]EHN10682.1 hypothetical protein PAI11_24850 [Patulibacter medicamentivorans]
MTEPLGGDQLAAIGWNGDHGLTSAGNQFLYFRKTDDDRSRDPADAAGAGPRGSHWPPRPVAAGARPRRDWVRVVSSVGGAVTVSPTLAA